MSATASQSLQRAIGRSPDRLTLEERARLVGKYVALEVYTPETLPLRRIEAIGDTLADCVRMLKSRGLDPTHFEFSQLHPAM
ncbi:conserved hypothetical protein [Candidatus Sulfopaludibacter sp. SbA3]|nr:conserved hypothetical protein [Candidatus Sulfopaludibacter sp. SbA3]